MIGLRRLLRRVLGRDQPAGSQPIPSLSPVTTSSSFTAAAATPHETQPAPLSQNADVQGSRISSTNQPQHSPIAPARSADIIGAQGPVATPSNQYAPALKSRSAVPTQHQRVEFRTPTNSTVASRFSVRSAKRSDTNDSRQATMRPFAARDLQREARRLQRRVIYTESYSIYNLEWEKLREWLVSSFPDFHSGTDVVVGPPMHLRAYLLGNSKGWQYVLMIIGFTGHKWRFLRF